MAPLASKRALLSNSPCHPSLLWQCKCCLSLDEFDVTSMYQVHRDQSTLCPWEGHHWNYVYSSCAYYLSVCKHLHQVSTNVGLHWVSLRSECSPAWLSVDDQTYEGVLDFIVRPSCTALGHAPIAGPRLLCESCLTLRILPLRNNSVINQSSITLLSSGVTSYHVSFDHHIGRGAIQLRPSRAHLI
jgi:hypothetical protein